MKSFFNFLALFGSMSTLVCCALPALFVSLGAGAALAGVLSHVPQLIWISQHKRGVFLTAGLLLAFSGLAQWQARNAPCPIDPALARSCQSARRNSLIVYFISLGVYVTGAAFAFIF
jgi:hypothetical protein